MSPRTLILLPALLAAGASSLATTACSASPLRDHAGPYEVQVLLDGAPARTFAHDGETWVLGQLGRRYTLRLVNHSGRRIEAVVSVDGRDVIDGKPGDFARKRGYLVPAWGSVDVDGWRLSDHEAAAFRFSSVAESYAVRTGGGREVGVIGVAVFPERLPPPRPRPLWVPPPPPPPYGWRDDGYRGDAHGNARPSPKAEADESPRSAAGSAAPPAAASGGGFRGRAGAGAADDAVAEERAASRGAPAPERRPGLGTEFGEAVGSEVREVEFVRASPARPATIMGVRYDDHDGLVAVGIDVDGLYDGVDPYLRRTADPFPVADRRYAAPPTGWTR